jgi:hypothetical protein
MYRKFKGYKKGKIIVILFQARPVFSTSLPIITFFQAITISWDCPFNRYHQKTLHVCGIDQADKYLAELYHKEGKIVTMLRAFFVFSV